MPTKTQKWINEYHRQTGFARSFEKNVTADLTHGLQTFKKSISQADIERAVRSGSVEQLLRKIPWDKLDKALAPANKRIVAAGAASAKVQLKQIPLGDDLRFDVRNPAFANYLSDKTGNLITLVQQDTLANVRRQTRKAFTSGLDPADVAARIHQGLGLNERQSIALDNFRNGLIAKGVKPKDVQAQAGAYAQRMLTYRANMVARTEIRFAANAADQAVWKAADDQGFLPSNAKKRWIVDGNPCPKICKPMNGRLVGINEKWRLPDGRRVSNPTESHPHCFCTAALDLGDYHPGFGGKRRR